MRRHWSQRIFAALLGISYAIVGMDPGAAGSCPMHRIAAPAVVAAAESPAPVDHSAHAGHTLPASASATAPSSDQSNPSEGGHSHSCTCPDGGCSSPALALAAPSSVPAPEAVLAAKPRAPASDLKLERPDFVLPFP